MQPVGRFPYMAQLTCTALTAFGVLFAALAAISLWSGSLPDEEDEHRFWAACYTAAGGILFGAAYTLSLN